MAEIESDTKTYDEALYPRPASESDEDSEQSMADSEQSMVDSTEDHTSVNMEEESDNEKAILDDFTSLRHMQVHFTTHNKECIISNYSYTTGTAHYKIAWLF